MTMELNAIERSILYRRYLETNAWELKTLADKIKGAAITAGLPVRARLDLKSAIAKIEVALESLKELDAA
jgi:hypothetical protein